jgi:hypothetical protein
LELHYQSPLRLVQVYVQHDQNFQMVQEMYRLSHLHVN